MFTPAVTAYGSQPTVSPYALPSLSSVAQTTLIQELRRDDPPAILTNAQTCGYTSGAWSSAVTCGPQQSCTYYTTPYSAANFGCCSEGLGCGYVSTCLDYKAVGNPNRGGGVLISSEQFLCGSAFPYCSTVLLYGTTYAPGSSYSFYSYGCLTRSNPVVVAFQTTLDDRAEPTTSSSTSSSAEASSTPATTSSSSSSTSTWSSTTTESSETASPSPPTTSKVGAVASHTSAGTLSWPTASSATASPSSATTSTGLSQTSQIGIAVGVSVGVGLLLAALGLAIWRHRKAKNDKKWHDQPARSFSGQYYETDGNQSLHPFDHKFSSLRSASSVGKSEVLREAPYELSSTGRRHELAANN